jgi:amino acid permease
MSAQDTWVLIGFSFLPLAIGAGLLFVAFRVARGWWRAPVLLAAALVLCYWAVIVFTAAYPTIDQPSSGYRCTTADLTPIPCPTTTPTLGP